HAGLARLDARARGEGSREERRSAARARGERGPRQGQGRHRRTVRRSQGLGPGLLRHRGARPGAGRRGGVRLPDPRGRGFRRDPSGDGVNERLFRRESGRIVAALTRFFGPHNLALAEDVVQDAFCRALEVWKVRGIPDNPSAWLMATAKNRALDIMRRDRTARTFAPEIGRLLESDATLAPVI